VKAGADTPAATDYRRKRSTAPHVVIAVAGVAWRLRFALDVPPSTGALRDLSATVAAMTGCDATVALRAVVNALEAPHPVAPLEAAA
jgi:hypothetical protein